MINNFKKTNVLINYSKLQYFFYAFFIYFIYFESFEVTLPLFLNYLKIDVIFLGWILSISKVCRAIIVIPVSQIKKSDKINFLLFILFMNILFIIFMLNTKNSYIISVCSVILITTTSIFNVILNPRIGSKVSNDKIGITFAIRDIFLYFGGFTGLIISGYIIKNYRIDAIFYFYIFLFIILITILFIINKKEKRIQIEEKNNNYRMNISEYFGNIKKLFDFINKKEIEENMDFKNYIVVNILFTVSVMSFSYIPLYAIKMKIGESSIYYLFSSSLIISSVLSLVGGAIIDKFEKRKILVIDGLISLFIIMLFIFNIKSLFIIGIVMTGLGTLLDNANNAYIFNTFTEEFLDRKWGVISSINLIASSFGIILFGFIYKTNSNLLFPLAFIITILGIWKCRKLKKTK